MGVVRRPSLPPSTARRRSPSLGVPRAVAGRHVVSHHALLRSIEEDSQPLSGAHLDLVVIPTSRPFAQSLEAIQLAARLCATFGARLLVICSAGAHRDEFPAATVEELGVKAAVIDLPGRSPVPSFSTTTHRLVKHGWVVDRDVAEKRNLALWIAAAMGWRHVLFVDDDICHVDRSRFPAKRLPEFGPDSVRQSLAALCSTDGPDAVGWIMTQFWDNSVVCHARRLGGLKQDSFIGGGALMVKVSEGMPFFPKIYNEDWLFFYGLLRGRPSARRALGLAGMVGQRPYRPYHLRRAQSEELGDVLAEGLFAALHHGRAQVLVGDRDYWVGAIRCRQEMLAEVRLAVLRSVITRWGSLGRHRPRLSIAAAREWRSKLWGAACRRLQAYRAVRSATAFHRDVRREVPDVPGMIVDYLECWEKDLRAWRGSLRRASRLQVQRLVFERSETTVIGATSVKQYLADGRGCADAAPSSREPSPEAVQAFAPV